MATFSWKGRLPSGQEITGELEARSKETVIEKLREQRIVVSSITERRTGGEPADPDRVSGRAPASRSRTLVVAIVFVAIAAAISYFAPVTTYRCTRNANGRADCVVTELVLGVYPLQVQQSVSVASVDIDSDGDRSRLAFTDRRGQSIRAAHWNESSSTLDVRSDLASFLADSKQHEIFRWHVRYLPAVLSGMCLLTAALMIVVVVLKSLRD